MLTPTDIHYITGFLYVASGQNLVNVTLGDKIFDSAAKKKRDVDISVLVAGSIGLIAAEVKHHRRKLDVSVVEGICQKFADMPDVRDRAIVSTSGYTLPARKKAKRHNVACLTFVRGPLPQFKTIDISQIRNITVKNRSWAAPPHVVLGPNVHFSQDERELISEITEAEASDGSVVTLKELANRVARQIDFSDFDFRENGQTQLDVTLPFDKSPTISLPTRNVSIPEVRIRGVVSCTEVRAPCTASCYLADEDDEPFAATLVLDVGGRLIGLTASAEGQELRTFIIPSDVRRERPVLKTIFDTTA